MNSNENPDDLELPAAKKVCLDDNDVSNSFRNNSSLSDSTFHLGSLFSPRQSVSSCSINDGVGNNTFSTPIHNNQVSDESKCINDDENKDFTLATSATDDKTDKCIVMSDSTPECVKIIQSNINDSPSLSKLNVSSLSTKAFNIDESLDFMDETCNEYHSDENSNGNLVSIDDKSLKNMIEKSGNIDETTVGHELESSMNEDSINLSKNSGNCSDKLEVTLDYTCKTDVISEGALILCHSTIKKDALSPSCKLFLEPSLTSMSIDESLVSDLNNIPCQPIQKPCSDLISKKPLIKEINLEGSCIKMSDDPNSTNLFNEVSGCVLDYTCSKLGSFDMNETYAETFTNKVIETSINVIPECSYSEQLEVNKCDGIDMNETCEEIITNNVKETGIDPRCSNAEKLAVNKSDLVVGSHDQQTEDGINVKDKNFLNLENSVSQNPITDLYDLSDLKNSFISNKTFSAEEVNFLKENLLKVMELLKSDNNSFESYKLSSENEKRELLEKIKFLESNSAVNNTSSAENIVNSPEIEIAVEGKIDPTGNNNSIYEELSNIQIQYNNLLQLVLVTKSNWTENKLFADFLSDLNVALNEVFIPIKIDANEYVINHKKIYDIMLSISKEISKRNNFKEECINILNSYESSLTHSNGLHITAKECGNDDFLCNLKATFEGILNNKNYLEKENAELKKEVCNKSDEIKTLSSTIEKLNEHLNGFKSIHPEGKDSEMETEQNSSMEGIEKLIYDSLDESNVNMTDLKESLAKLKMSLSLIEENYNNVSSKCEKYEIELQKMREVEQVNKELLLQYNDLKTEVGAKCCEIEKINIENHYLICQIEELKLKYEIKDEGFDPKIRSETSQKSLADILDNTNEILVPYDQDSKETSSQNCNIALLNNDEENSKKQFEMIQNNSSMKEEIVEFLEDRNGLENQSISPKEEVSKLQLHLDCLKEKYSEIVSNFDIYKQTYTHTEDESSLWKEEKQSLKCELDSLKSQLESAHDEASKLNAEKEEINNNLKAIENKLCEEKLFSRDIQNSYEIIKIKYEESVIEINNKTLELQTLLTQLSDLEAANANLKIELNGIHSDSDDNISSLQNEISELKIKCDTSDKLYIELTEKHDEIKASYDKMCEDLESKNADLSFLTGCKEQLEVLNQNESLLKQKIVDLQEGRNSLEAQFLSSKDEVSKLQFDLDCLNGKYCETVSNFDLHKQTYTCTEEESSLWKEEKQSLEFELNSFKSQLQSVQEELLKLKSENEETNKKMMTQLTELETTNANLKTQLSGAHSDSNDNIETLNNEISELKVKCETSDKLFIDLKEKHNEIKVSYDKISDDLETKQLEIELLTSSKAELEKELELLNQKILDLQDGHNGLEVQLLSSEGEVSKLQFDLECLNGKYSEIVSNFDLYKQTYTCTEQDSTLWKEEKHLLECELDSLKSQLEHAYEESSQLKSEKEEINNNLKTIENQLSEEKLSSRDIQESYEDLKIKYEDSVNDLNNKAIELQNLLAQLTDIEKNSANLKIELSSLRSDSELDICTLQNKIREQQIKFDTSEKLLIDHEKTYSELKVSYDKIHEDLESKNLEFSLLMESKEKLETELEMINQSDDLLKKQIVELQEVRNDLENQFLSSKEEVSKLQLDLDCLKEKYSEMSCDFSKYKEIYTCTDDECILLKEEKHSLECELNSLKSQLENAHDESSKLKSEKEEINNNLKNIENQLCEAKQNNRNFADDFENLKTKHEESVAVINNKTLEIQNLLTQLSDLETTNANLKSELNNLCNNAEINVDLLNKEISELKIKCDFADQLSVEHEKKYNELKITYDQVCENLETKNLEIELLTSSKAQLEQELELLNQNETLLKQKIVDLQEDRNSLEAQYLSSKDEVSKLQLDLECLNGKYCEIVSNFDLYKQTYTCTEDESNLWKEDKQSLECELDSLKSQLENAYKESSKLKSEKEEINNNLKTIENQLCEEKLCSRDIKESCENLKSKYEESVNELNNKTIELENLLAQLTAIEKNNANLKNELSSLRSDSEHHIDLINQEVHDLKRKCEISEKLLIDHENIYSELKVSYDKICEDLESKNLEVSLLTESKEKLEKELEIFSQSDALLKKQIVELQEVRNDLENQFLSSKEEVSKLQLDLDCLKEKYSEMSCDFSKYKEIYTCTDDECILLKEEKHSLECKLNSLKSQLENAYDESSKLKSEKEEINNNLKNIENQLCEAKQSSRNFADDFENLKTKHEESVADINNKTLQIQNLLTQLSDLEGSHMNLKSELNAIRCESENNMDLLNKEILELKGKCENSEKLFADLEESHNEMKVLYDQIREDFESKQKEFSLLTNCKEQLEKEIGTLTENNSLYKQKLTDLEINEEAHQKAILDLNKKLDDANLKIDCMKNVEIQIGVLKNEYYDILSLYITKDKEICGEQYFCLISEFVNAVEAIIKDLLLFKGKCSEEVVKLSNYEEEIARLNVLVDSLKEEIKLSAEDSDKLQANYSSLSKQYNTLLDASKDSNIRCNSLLEKLKDLESHNSLYKSAIDDLKSEITAKESTIVRLSNMKELYESAVKENETLSSQLSEKIKEYENTLDKLKNGEEKYVALQLEYSTLSKEINDLRNTNETLEIKSSENYALYMSVRDNIEMLQKEKEEIRKNFIKCEKDYQNSLDLVKKTQENMGNLDRQYNLSIAKMNAILKEKESYESQNLSLQKINDELVNRIKELNSKCLENQNMLMKFRELEKSYEVVSRKHQSLEKQLVDYGNLKRENEILKIHVSEKDSFTNSLSTNYDTLKNNYSSLTDELKSLSSAVLALVPGENSAMEVLKFVEEKLQVLKKVESDLEEEKMKCQNLDEECNLLNEDLNFKDVVIGDMYKDHSSQMNELKESLKKEENLRQEILLENSTLKDKIKCLDSEIIKLKTTKQSVCSSCVELKGVLHKLKMDLVDNSSKVTTLQLQIEENEITNKKKIHDYRKKISSLQEELGAALNKLEDNRLKNEIVRIDAFSQTESLPVQISGQSGIVQSFKIKEQEEKIQKFEKENLILKRMCQSRLQTIQELKTKLENVSKPQKTQRNALEEVQNHQSS